MPSRKPKTTLNAPRLAMLDPRVPEADLARRWREANETMWELRDKRERVLAYLLHIGWQPGEIAAFLGVSISSIRIARGRLNRLVNWALEATESEAS